MKVYDSEDVRRLVLDHAGLRIEPIMGQYVARRLGETPGAQSIPIIGGDARTGVPVRVSVAAADLLHRKANDQ